MLALLQFLVRQEAKRTKVVLHAEKLQGSVVNCQPFEWKAVKNQVPTSILEIDNIVEGSNPLIAIEVRVLLSKNVKKNSCLEVFRHLMSIWADLP